MLNIAIYFIVFTILVFISFIAVGAIKRGIEAKQKFNENRSKRKYIKKKF